MSLKHMKALIVLVLGLLAVGCATLTPEEKKAFRDSVVGEYEIKYEDGDTRKLVLLDNGIRESYVNVEKLRERKWSIVKGEIQFYYEDGFIEVYRINKDTSITWIADIDDGKRTDYSKEDQITIPKTM